MTAELTDAAPAIQNAKASHTRTVAPDRERVPPVPGAEWCGSCDSWAYPSAYLCRCNNR
ncbi:hypothetical protein ACFRCI_03300 [Streptomyces sp. NPDC056638]|uniref:hypothetical protein n=1 Tax=Streptomyces sp. NPDC056638 TaxID=3345887 RepID=UPI00367E7ABA